MIRKYWSQYLNRLLGDEISQFSIYFEEVIQCYPLPSDIGELLGRVNCAKRVRELQGIGPQNDGASSLILLNGSLNQSLDIQGLLSQLTQNMSRGSRISVVLYNSYFRWLYAMANTLGLRRAEIPTTALTRLSFEGLAKLANCEIVKSKPICFVPFSLFGLGTLLNRILPMVPLLKWFSLAYVVVLRPIKPEVNKMPSLTVVIPARNEKGNIENAIQTLPRFNGGVEVIFVEGHSQDGTWEEILRVQEKYKTTHKIRAIQQKGKGKNDAVRAGFEIAKNEILTIWDADLTVPPDFLLRFYRAYCEGRSDFINGTRLVYPMEGEAMRFLNLLGNIFFAKSLSWVLGANLGDTLCGTKLFSRADYKRFVKWREKFGDFDPFGDFELIFPAAILGVGIIDIPVPYRARTYGSTNIQRFRHGWILLKMTMIGFFRIKLK